MKKQLLRFILCFSFLITFVKGYAQCVSYDVHACIDYMDDLHFQGNQLWWVHFGGSNPGEHSSCSGDVLSVNGTPWGNWSTPFTISGNTTCMTMTSNVTQCSNACYLQQAPSGSNNWETIYRFDDSGPSAAHPYKITFTFCPATPTSPFTVSSPACAGNNVTITFTGSASSNATFNWDFNGATVISGSNEGPYVVQWAAPGNYNVSLDVTDCSVTSTITTVPVTVSVSPTSFFTASSPVCKDSTSVITYTGSGTSGATYNWNFNGGTIASGSGQGPLEVQWSSSGEKHITLTVNESGCLSPLHTDTVQVLEPKTSTFTTSPPICRGDAATITYTGDASITANYFWDFDGGAVLSGSGQGPYTVTWPFAGVYNCKLAVSEGACPSPLTVVQQIVIPPPHANFSAEDVCFNQANSFLDLSSFTGGSITGWQWNFGDGSAVNTSQNPNYTYTSQGTYDVTLIATNNNGCKDTIKKSVVVHPLPQALFNAGNNCLGLFSNFTSQSAISNPDAIQVSAWRFGDGASISSPTATHLYSQSGPYNVQLLVVSNFGCKDSVTHPITVNPTPVANFTTVDTAGCTAWCVNFQNASNISPSGAIVQWLWSAGDSSEIINSLNYAHCYTNDSAFISSYYTVGLTVVSDSGCTNTITKPNYINVYPNPVADFTATPQETTIANSAITITDASIAASNWSWHFGDNDTSSLAVPVSHEYTDTGNFVITLIVANQFTCKDTSYQTVIIDPDFLFYIPNSFSPNGNGVNETFSGKGLFINEYKMNVFDRWGNLIFTTTDLNIPWDGKIKGGSQVAMPDVYVYSIELIDIKKREHTYRGTVTLVK